MQTDSMHVMPWRIEDIDLSRIDRQRAVVNEDLLLLLCAASFIESGTDDTDTVGQLGRVHTAAAIS